MDWSAVRERFPVTARYTYLDHARTSAPSAETVRAMTDFLVQHSETGILRIDEWRETLRATREAVGRLVNAPPGSVAFTRNTTHGLATVANGIRWSPGDNVVVPAGEFPANVYPWLSLDRIGVETRFVPDGTPLTAERIEPLIDSRTRVLAISAASFSTGARPDLGRLGEMCRRRDVLLVVDAFQAVGVIPVDVARDRIDVLATASHKWLLGPLGVGFLCVNDRALDRIDPTCVSWYSVAHRDFFTHDRTLHPDARRYEDGHFNYAGVYGLKSAVGQARAIGIGAVEARVGHLRDFLAAGVRDRGARVLGPERFAEGSGIVLAEGFREPAEAVHGRLTAGRVVVTRFGDRLRFSVHYFNTEAEIDRALDLALPRGW